MLDFGQFDFGQFDFGQLAGIKLAEVEINWPKSKLIGRSRNWPKSNRWCLLCFFFLSFFFVFCFVFSSTPNLHPISDGPFRWTTLRRTTLHRTTLRRTTLHRTTLRRTTLRRTTLRRTTLRRTAQNFALFFLSPAGNFILLSLSWGPFVEFCWCF